MKYSVDETVELRDDMTSSDGDILVEAGAVGVVTEVLDDLHAYKVRFEGQRNARVVMERQLL